MAHAQFLDELIREYLLFKGFGNALKSFDIDLKSDKEKSFRTDKIIENIIQFINLYDLNSLRELWRHLDKYLFTKLENHFVTSVKKLENAVLKMYLVNALMSNKTDKVNEFFIKMTPELQNQNEWKDWFVIPYIKNPEDNPTFSLYFTKQWQDTLLVSVHNLLASIFQYMPKPALMHFEDDAIKISKLEQKNEFLKRRLAFLIDKSHEFAVTPCHVEPPPHLLDDFYVIAQESSIIDSQTKSLKNIIRNMSSSSSPILGRKENASFTSVHKKHSGRTGKGLKNTPGLFNDL